MSKKDYIEPDEFQVNDLVMINRIGFRHHGAIARILHLKTWGGVKMADVSIHKNRRVVEVEIDWLLLLVTDYEQKTLFDSESEF